MRPDLADRSPSHGRIMIDRHTNDLLQRIGPQQGKEKRFAVVPRIPLNLLLRIFAIFLGDLVEELDGALVVDFVDDDVLERVDLAAVAARYHPDVRLVCLPEDFGQGQPFVRVLGGVAVVRDDDAVFGVDGKFIAGGVVGRAVRGERPYGPAPVIFQLG